MMRTLSPVTVAAALAFGLAACSSPSGPVAPGTVGSPLTKVTLTPDIAPSVSVPSVQTPQVFTYTEDGLLKYQFQLQNKTDQSFFLRVQATFFDAQGVAIDNQNPTREAFGPFEIKTIQKVSSNNLARDVRVQVAPAR